MSEKQCSDHFASNILVVDDIPAARRIVTRMLAGQGYRSVKEAGSVAEGVLLASAESFELIIVDVHLKDGTAIDLIKKVREAKGCDAPGFMVITSDLDVETFADVAKQGITSYLLKPFNVGMLNETLMEFWSGGKKSAG